MTFMISTTTLAGTFSYTPSAAFSSTALFIGLGVALLFAVGCIIASVIAYLPKKAKSATRLQPVDSVAAYKKRVTHVEDAYTAGDMTKQAAFHELAAIARQFASSRMGKNMTSHTLADLTNAPHTSHTSRQGFSLLRSTIEGLYPPEFAYEATHAQSSQVTVIQACRWVMVLIERWDD
ncbi:hypothetical protein [Alloscardovia criceti]|uniref:hypothetical protein n=1 Tax=Alloscardovia criceti TaxID=356828 RepID=UPI00035FE665|nr:hypothetical protein [Alloscardovia criceti]